MEAGWETGRRLSDETFLDSSQVRGSAALGAQILEVEAEEVTGIQQHRFRRDLQPGQNYLMPMFSH